MFIIGYELDSPVDQISRRFLCRMDIRTEIKEVKRKSLSEIKVPDISNVRQVETSFYFSQSSKEAMRFSTVNEARDIASRVSEYLNSTTVFIINEDANPTISERKKPV